MKIGQYTFARTPAYSHSADALVPGVKIIGPDFGDNYPYRETITLPIEMLVRYAQNVAKKTKKTKKAVRKKR